MTNHLRLTICSLFRSLFLGLGLLLFVSPLLLYWWIHGNFERYLWIINGPYPYSHFGSTPVQLVMFLGLFFAGLLCFLFAYLLADENKG